MLRSGKNENKFKMTIGFPENKIEEIFEEAEQEHKEMEYEREQIRKSDKQ